VLYSKRPGLLKRKVYRLVTSTSALFQNVLACVTFFCGNDTSIIYIKRSIYMYFGGMRTIENGYVASKMASRADRPTRGMWQLVGTTHRRCMFSLLTKKSLVCVHADLGNIRKWWTRGCTWAAKPLHGSMQKVNRRRGTYGYW